jgi:type IV pilus assembly protein PilV
MGKAISSIRNRSVGFSMIEVLVTLVIVAIGLLGVAGLQVSAVKLNYVAESRSAGAVYVFDIIERMRANVANVDKYAVVVGTTPSGTTRADLDVADWKRVLATLPRGDGSIAISPVDVAVCRACTPSSGCVACLDVTVEVQWDEGNAGGSSTQKFTTKTRL